MPTNTRVIVNPLQVIEGDNGKEYQQIIFQTTAQAVDLTGFTSQQNPNDMQFINGSTDTVSTALAKVEANTVYLSNHKINSDLFATTATPNKLLALNEDSILDATATNANKLNNVDASEYALKTDIPNLDSYVSDSELTQTLNNYALKSEIPTDYVTDADLEGYVSDNELSTTLSSYVTTQNLTSTLNSYVTTETLTNTLTGYVEDSDLDEYVMNSATTTTAAANKLLYLDANSKLPATAQNADALGGKAANLYALKTDIPSDYVTSDDLASYVTTSSLNTTLENYATNDDLDEYVMNSATATTATANKLLYLNASGKLPATADNADKLGNVAANLYALKEDLDDYVANTVFTGLSQTVNEINSNYVSDNELSTTLSSYITSTSLNQTLNNYALKTEIPTDYLTTEDLAGYVESDDLATILSSYLKNTDATATATANKLLYLDADAKLQATANNADNLGGVSASQYALKSDLSDYVTSNNLSTTLSSYVTTQNLTSTLNNYVTSSSLNTTLSGYVENGDLANYALKTDLNNYVESDDLTTILASYVTSTTLSATLEDYATNDDLAGYVTTSQLANYVTTSSLNTTLSSYAKTSQLSNYIQTSAAATTATPNKLLYLDTNGKLQATANNADKLGNVAASQYALKSDITSNSAFDSDGHLVSPAGWKIWITDEN